MIVFINYLATSGVITSNTSFIIGSGYTGSGIDIGGGDDDDEDWLIMMLLDSLYEFFDSSISGESKDDVLWEEECIDTMLLDKCPDKELVVEGLGEGSGESSGEGLISNGC